MDSNQDFLSSAQKISGQVQHDCGYPEFFNRFIEDNESIHYCCSPTLGDIATFSSIVPFPTDIALHYSTAQLKASFGCISEIDRFYCITDNKLFLWRSTDTSICEQVKEDVSVITTVCLCGVDPVLLGYIPSIKYTLVLATPEYIKVIPISGERIDFTQFYLTEINFAPFCIAPGPEGRIFIGGDCGQIFLMRFETDSFSVKSIAYNYSVTDWTYGIFPRLLKATVGYQTPSIVQMCFDASMTYIAAIDDQSHIRFFNYEVTSDSCTVLSIENSDQYEMASICCCPPIDPEHPRFIGICKDGKRICFGKSLNKAKSGSDLSFGILAQKDPPPELEGEQVVCARCFMGLTIFLCKKNAIIMRGQRYSETEFCEFVAVEKLPGPGLALGEANVQLSFTDPLIWQHNIEPPFCYILTVAGGYKCRFSLPCESLNRLIVTARGFLNDDIHEWFSNFQDDITEPVTNALLCCFHCPEHSDWSLFVASQYASSFVQENNSQSNNRSLMIDGLVIRIARILEPVWYSTILCDYMSKKNEQKWMVAPALDDISPILVAQLDNVKLLMKKYIENHTAATETILVETSAVFQAEKHQIGYLTKFIDQLIEILKLIGILSQQKKKFVTGIVNMFEEGAKTQEEIDNRTKRIDFIWHKAFGNCLLEFDTFIDVLRGCTYVIFTKINPSSDLDILAQQLSESCPSLSYVSNAKLQVGQAVDRLEAVLLSDSKVQKIYLPIIVNVFIEYAGEYISPLVLNEIVAKLIKMDDLESALEIIEAKIIFLDPSNRALYYFRNGCDDNDEEGLAKLNDVYNFMCASISQISSCARGFDVLMKSRLEIIHIHVFNDLIEQPEKLIRLNSPYLKDFVKDYANEYYWKFLLVRGDTESSYKELVRLAKENEGKKDKECLEWLNMAISYAQRCNAKREEISEIQKQFYAILRKSEINRIPDAK